MGYIIGKETSSHEKKSHLNKGHIVIANSVLILYFPHNIVLTPYRSLDCLMVTLLPRDQNVSFYKEIITIIP